MSNFKIMYSNQRSLDPPPDTSYAGTDAQEPVLEDTELPELPEDIAARSSSHYTFQWPDETAGISQPDDNMPQSSWTDSLIKHVDQAAPANEKPEYISNHDRPLCAASFYLPRNTHNQEQQYASAGLCQVQSPRKSTGDNSLATLGQTRDFNPWGVSAPKIKRLGTLSSRSWHECLEAEMLSPQWEIFEDNPGVYPSLINHTGVEVPANVVRWPVVSRSDHPTEVSTDFTPRKSRAWATTRTALSGRRQEEMEEKAWMRQYVYPYIGKA